MSFTGERVEPDNPKLKLTYIQSLKAYDFAKKYCRNKNILDIGSGEGYGTNFLSRFTSTAIGLDYDEEAVKRAKKKYKSKNLKFVRENFLQASFKPNSFDVVCSFQTIEHIKNIDLYLEHVSNLLKKGGKFIVSTPNKDFVIDVYNPYHFHEFSVTEFKNKLEKVFSSVEVYGVFGNSKVTKLRKKNQRIAMFIVKLDPLRLRYLLPRKLMAFTYTAGVNLVKTLLYSREKGKIVDLNLDDFYVSEYNTKNSADLLAVCQK